MSLLSVTKKMLNREDKPKTAKATPEKATKKKSTAVVSLQAAALDMRLSMTEKNLTQQAKNVLVVRVKPTATKGGIASAVAEKFGVKVLGVRTAQFHPKRRQRGATIGRTNYYKKAYVTVDDISKINVAP